MLWENERGCVLIPLTINIHQRKAMFRFVGLWVFFLLLTCPIFLQADVNSPSTERGSSNLKNWEEVQQNNPSSLDKQKMQPHVLAKIEILDQQDARNFMKTFYLGELNIAPYTPVGIQSYTARSQADFSFKLPEYCGSIKVKTGLCYHLADNSRSGVGSQEQVLYLVSTKTLNGSKWKPFLSLSYLRSQVKGAPKAFIVGLKELQNLSSVDYNGPLGQTQRAHQYQNVAVLETCCGLQPMKNLFLILSFNYLKPVDRKVNRLNTTKKFDDVKLKSHSQGVDVRLEYKVRKGLNLLVKSECLLSNGILRDKDAKPVLIEGQLIVSF